MNYKKNAKSKIRCSICKNINKIPQYNINNLYKRLSCNKNLCLECKDNHNKKHILVEYQKKDFICNIHNKYYISYCKKCKKNLCSSCENEHKKENDLL